MARDVCLLLLLLLGVGVNRKFRPCNRRRRTLSAFYFTHSGLEFHSYREVRNAGARCSSSRRSWGWRRVRNSPAEVNATLIARERKSYISLKTYRHFFFLSKICIEITWIERKALSGDILWTFSERVYIYIYTHTHRDVLETSLECPLGRSLLLRK